MNLLKWGIGAALAVLLVGCGASVGRYWYKAHPELPLLKMAFVDERVVTVQCREKKAFMNELEAQKGKHINDQAYNLLKEDINWLLNN